jgi:pimeloyl-ACP methyl ester carboxylesterase
LDALEVFKKFSTKKNVLIGHSYGTTLVARLNQFITNVFDENVNESISGVVLMGTAWELPDGD